MKIETFAKLWQEKYPTGSAENMGRTVRVTYSSNGKVYNYHGSVYSVAERLNLIPDININTQANKIIAALKDDKEIIAPSGCLDTVVWMWGACNDNPAPHSELHVGTDEFDRPLDRYFLEVNRWG